MFGLERGASIADMIRRRRAEYAEEQRQVDDAVREAHELLEQAKASRRARGLRERRADDEPLEP